MEIDYNKAVTDGLNLFLQGEWQKKYTVKDLERYLIYPIKHDKIRIYYKGDDPIGLITWCWLNKEEGKKFLNSQHYITEKDYVGDHKVLSNSKKELWGIEFIAPYGDALKIMKTLKKEHDSYYEKTHKVNWRRLHNPSKRHTREF